MTTQITTLQYYIGQALQAQLAKKDDVLDLQQIAAIAENAVEIGFATAAAEADHYRKKSDTAAQNILA